MGFSTGGLDSYTSEPNVIPMIDIMLVLLIIFMMQVAQQRKAMDIQLPPEQQVQQEQMEQVTSNQIVLQLGADGSYALNADTIPRLKSAIVCGAANNQLAESNDAQRLRERGILYAPDFIVNAGGVINVFFELGRKYDRDAAVAKTAHIYDTMTRVIETAARENITTAKAADHIAEERINAAREGASR